jgi:D-3-phosphoglycerate dehydrogenase / 2-oxoglutarate reductase
VSKDNQDEILVLVTEPVTDAALAWLKDRGGVPILVYEGEDWQPLADRIRAIIVRAFRVDKEVLDRLPALEIVVKHGTGVNTIDLNETTARGIKVTNTPGANANAVAEHSVALLSGLSHDLMDSDTLVREGRFTERNELRQTKELTESRLGIIGAGRIGRRIAQICRGGYGCEIGFVDPYVPAEEITGMGANMFGDVDELFIWADNVVVAAPLTPETRMLIGASTLKLLGAEGSLVCASRGGIVDEVALAEAVRNGVIRGAALDVYEPEPPSPDHPLISVRGTILTPHVAFSSDAAIERMSMDSVTQLWDLLHGREAPVVAPGSWG